MRVALAIHPDPAPIQAQKNATGYYFFLNTPPPLITFPHRPTSRDVFAHIAMKRYDRGPGRRRFGLKRFLAAAKKAFVLSPGPSVASLPGNLLLNFFVESP